MELFNIMYSCQCATATGISMKENKLMWTLDTTSFTENRLMFSKLAPLRWQYFWFPSHSMWVGCSFRTISLNECRYCSVWVEHHQKNSPCTSITTWMNTTSTSRKHSVSWEIKKMKDRGRFVSCTFNYKEDHYYSQEWSMSSVPSQLQRLSGLFSPRVFSLSSIFSWEEPSIGSRIQHNLFYSNVFRSLEYRSEHISHRTRAFHKQFFVVSAIILSSMLWFWQALTLQTLFGQLLLLSAGGYALEQLNLLRSPFLEYGTHMVQ